MLGICWWCIFIFPFVLPSDCNFLLRIHLLSPGALRIDSRMCRRPTRIVKLTMQWHPENIPLVTIYYIQCTHLVGSCQHYGIVTKQLSVDVVTSCLVADSFPLALPLNVFGAFALHNLLLYYYICSRYDAVV